MTRQLSDLDRYYRAVPERDVLDAALGYLARVDPGGFYWRANTGAARLPGKNGREQLVMFGERGQSDILGVTSRGGRLCAFETKRERGTLSPYQIAFLERVEAAGGVCAVLRPSNYERMIDAALGVTE